MQQSAGFPPGMVAMFSGASCPEGWTDEPLTQGRIATGAATPAESGEVAGEPFVDKQARNHQHPFLITATLSGSGMPYGCCTPRRWVADSTPEMAGDSDEWNTNLPFYAIRMCRKEQQQ